MTKLTLKLKAEHLKLIINDYYNAEPQPIISRVNKMVASISNELLQKLERKLITKRKEAKAFKISLKYHEAFTLLEICKYQQDFVENEWEVNAYRLIINQIDQQL